MKYVLLIAMGLLFWSCFNEGNCLVSATNFMQLQFKKKSNHNLDTAVAFDSILISGADKYLKFRNDTLVTAIVLPVDINNDTTAFIFQRKSIVDSTIMATDTLKVSYTRQTKVLSRDCGAYTFYTNLKIIKTSANLQLKIISTSLVKDPTSSAYAVNYQIFY